MTSLRQTLGLMVAIWRGEPVVYRAKVNGTLTFPRNSRMAHITECVLAGPPPLSAQPFGYDDAWQWNGGGWSMR